MEKIIRTENKFIITYTNEKDELHRLDGPAVIWKSGAEAWYRNDKPYRPDGPAAIYADGRISKSSVSVVTFE